MDTFDLHGYEVSVTTGLGGKYERLAVFTYQVLRVREPDLNVFQPLGSVRLDDHTCDATFLLPGGQIDGQPAYQFTRITDTGPVCPYCVGTRHLNLPTGNVPCRYCHETGQARNVEADPLALWREHLAVLDGTARTRLLVAMERNART